MIEDILEEDATIQNYEVLDNNLSLVEDTSSLKVLDALEDSELNFYLKLNGDMYNFNAPTINVRQEATRIQKSEFAEILNPKVEKGTSDHTISGYLTKIQKTIDSSKKKDFNPEEVLDILSDYTKNFINDPNSSHRVGLARSNIYKLYLKKIQIQKSIQDLEADKSVIDSRAQTKTNLLFTSIFVTSFVEFLIGYYCIYEVEWLGWDIVEPVTYTIAQGKFVLGTWFFWKYMTDSNCTDLNSFFNNRFKYKMYKKKLFEFERLEYLKNQISEIDKQIDIEEHSMSGLGHDQQVESH